MNLICRLESGQYPVAIIMKKISLFILCAWAFSANANELQGTVVGKDKLPKKYVSVSIFGSVNRRTQTNSDGIFFVDLPPGSYTIRIRQDPRRKEFSYVVSEKVNSNVFEVDW